VLIPDGLEAAWLAPAHGAELRALEPLLQPWDPGGWLREPVDRQQLSLSLEPP
jgi:hypothetical protein